MQRAAETAQFVTCLSCKNEDLRLVPRTNLEKLSMQSCTCNYNAKGGGGGVGVSLDLIGQLSKL